MNINSRYMTTGIGSLSYTDYAVALESIKRTFPEMPYWPHLPKVPSSQGLINQSISPLIKIGLVISEPGRAPYFDTSQPDWLEKLTEFYHLYLQIVDGDNKAFNHFAYSEKTTVGFYTFLNELSKQGFPDARYVKGQIIGPLTLGLQLNDQNRRASYYDKQLRDIVVKTIAIQAFWQAKVLGKYKMPVIIFIDEPGLYAYGKSMYITLNNEEITKELNEIIEPLSSLGVYTGIHVCASTDWSIITNSKTDIISFDAYEYFTSLSVYADDLKRFLDRNGVLAWGIVPTSDKALDISINQLNQVFKEFIETLVSKGLEKEVLLNKAIITPSCGTGTLSVGLCEIIHSLTRGFSQKLRK